MRRAPSLILLAMMSAALACGRGHPRHAVLEAVFTDSNQKPIPGIPISLNNNPVGETDAKGQFKWEWSARVGDQVTFRSKLPEGYEPTSGSSGQKTTMIGQYQSLEKTARTADGVIIESIPWEVVLKRQDVPVAAVVKTGCPNMAVALVNPARASETRTVAFTDRTGAALAALKLPAGQNFQFRLLTAHVPEIQPANPESAVFTAEPDMKPVTVRLDAQNCPETTPTAAAWVRLFTQPANANVFRMDGETRRWLGLATAEGIEIPIQTTGEYTFRAEKQGYAPAEIAVPLSAEEPTINPVIDLVLERLVEERGHHSTTTVSPTPAAMPQADSRRHVTSGSHPAEPERPAIVIERTLPTEGARETARELAPPVVRVRETAPPVAKPAEVKAETPAPTPAPAVKAAPAPKPGAGAFTVRTSPSGIKVLLADGGKETPLGTTDANGLRIESLAFGPHQFKLVDPATGFAKRVRADFNGDDPASASILVDMVRAQTLHRLERVWKDYTESGHVSEDDRGFLESLRGQADTAYDPARTILKRLESAPPAP